MILSIRTRLTLAFVAVAIILILLTGVLGRVLLETHFKEYIIERQEGKNKEIVALISQQWDSMTIENIGINALEQGLIVKVFDSSNGVVWDATEHNSGMCEQMISHMQENMMSRYPNWQGEFKVDKYHMSGGTIEIGYYGPFYFSDADLHFITALNTALLWVTGFALVFSIFIGTLFSRKISNPIIKVINTAQMIEKGKYNYRINEKSNTREIKDLTLTINTLAQTLENQEILRERLTADVAHELRTPLSTLQSHMEAMIDGIWQPSLERIRSCHEEVIRLNKLVGDLHTLATFEGENLIINKHYFDLFDLASNIILNYENEFKNNDIEISLTGQKQSLYADKDKISQVLINLISNSLKYTQPNGKVEVSIRQSEQFVEIHVNDNGNGIPEEDLPHIFDRFYRADKSRNRMTGGSGIGLTIVKAIVEGHGGTIDVKSKIDDGTTFIVKLPICI